MSKISISNLDELAREPLVRSLKRAVLGLVILVIMIVLVSEKDKIVQLMDHPIEKMSVVGQFSHIDSEQLKKHLSRFVGEGFLSADLDAVKEYIELLPWVYQARVTRVWPSEINVAIEEQVAVSYWNDEGLINAKGQLFIPVNLDKGLPIPTLSYKKAFEDQDRLEMYQLFRYIQQELAISELTPKQLAQNLRGAWEVILSNGIAINLGHLDLSGDARKSLDDKLERVGKLLMPKSNITIENIERLDTRYPNGIAVKWKENTVNKN